MKGKVTRQDITPVCFVLLGSLKGSHSYTSMRVTLMPHRTNMVPAAHSAASDVISSLCAITGKTNVLNQHASYTQQQCHSNHHTWAHTLSLMTEDSQMLCESIVFLLTSQRPNSLPCFLQGTHQPTQIDH